MATPHVAGAAALVWSAYPDLTRGGGEGAPAQRRRPDRPHRRQRRVPDGHQRPAQRPQRAARRPRPDAGDHAAPAAVGNLAASGARRRGRSTLNWTATGDDGATGRAGFYDVRYSTSPITEANWAAASPRRRRARPAAPRARPRRFTVTGLEPGTRYYFAMKVKDNAGNESALSNLAQGEHDGRARSSSTTTWKAARANWTATGLWHRSGLRGHDSATAWYYGQDEHPHLLHRHPGQRHADAGDAARPDRRQPGPAALPRVAAGDRLSAAGRGPRPGLPRRQRLDDRVEIVLRPSSTGSSGRST